jgi:N-succinyldiaminopimelate aminotransferase
MNSLLSKLQSYPFEKWRLLIEDIIPVHLKHISFGIGEPKHETPLFIKEALANNLDGLSIYPTTLGSSTLRQAIANWTKRRYNLEIHPDKNIIPVNGSREALFSFTQAVVDSCIPNSLVVCPNPFYQIYEGAILLAGAQPYFINTDAENNFACNYDAIPEYIWQQVQMVFVCSPNNPTGAVMNLEQWRVLFELSEKHDFIIASDECYSEIYFNDPPLGALEASKLLGRTFKNLVVFSSLSKRSNVPGLRSGFVAGDEKILELFLLYRTYHGCAMGISTQMASTAAWSDEEHVKQNRDLYQQKFDALLPILQPYFNVKMPDAGFYLWAKIPNQYNLSDTEFARELFANTNVSCLPGSYLAREAHGENPGQNYIRLALVSNLEECIEGAYRIADFAKNKLNSY